MNKPEKKFVAGAISATIWKNEAKSKKGEDLEFNTVNLQRSYQDKDGKWQTTSTLRVNDLPKAKLVLDRAYEYLVLKSPEITDPLEEEDVEIETING